MTKATRTVAIVAPDFPPSNMPPSIRTRLFATHLAELGWHPIVITTAAEHYPHATDSDNERLLPSGLEIIRTSAFSAKWMRRFGIGDIGMRTVWQQWRVLRRLCQSRRVDLVFISVPPYVPMILGRLAHECFGVPYVVDYQDPWVTETYWRAPRSERPPKWPLAYAMSRLLEPFSIRKASHITGVSEGTTSGVMERYPKLSATGTTALPFGAEPGDFDFLRAHPRANSCFDPSDGMIHLLYAGVCIPSMYPALRCLFGGLNSLRARNPELVHRVRLHFVGTSYAPGAADKRVMPVAEEFGLGDLVDESTARVAYLDALQLLLDATALLIVGTNEPHYTASKLYPYALSGKPILAILHEESSAVESLRALGPAHVLTFSDARPAESQTEAAAAYLGALVTEGAQAGVRADISGHTAKDMTRRLAAVFDGIVNQAKK